MPFQLGQIKTKVSEKVEVLRHSSGEEGGLLDHADKASMASVTVNSARVICQSSASEDRALNNAHNFTSPDVMKTCFPENMRKLH